MGSNLGDRRALLREAVRRIGNVVAVSSLYETAAVGGPEQGDYLNAVVLVETGRSAREVLDRLLTIERDMGRVRREKWGPRSIDLDLLVYGDDSIDEPGLTVPHPRLGQRRFVLEPLAEVWPDLVVAGRAATDLLAGVLDQGVSLVEPPEWAGI